MNKSKLISIILLLTAFLTVNTTLVVANKFSEYWVLDYDSEYFKVTYNSHFYEFSSYDILTVYLTVENISEMENYRLNFNGEPIDLTGYIEYTKTFDLTVFSELLDNVNTYREFTAILQQWNETDQNYYAIGKSSILRSEEYKTRDIVMPFFPITILLCGVIFLIYIKKKRIA